MSSKLIICVLVLWKCASCIVAEGDLNETFQKCVSLNDSYYCSQYKLMKFLKKQKTEPAATNTGIQTLDNIYINSQDYFSKLFKFIRNVLYSVLTKEDSDPMAKNGNKANLEELSPRKASLRGKSDDGGRRGSHTEIFFLSFIILAKLFNVMLLLAMISISFIIIKKVIIVATFALPVLFRNLQRVCQIRDRQPSGLFNLLKPLASSSNFIN